MNKKIKTHFTFLFMLIITFSIITPMRLLTASESEKELSLTVFTDKQHYLNGELVKVSGTVRYINGTPVEEATIGIEVKDCRNNTLFLDIVFSSSSGAYEDNFRIPLTATPGTYTVFVTAYKVMYLPASANSTFYVYPEAKPDFILSASPASQKVSTGETASYTVTITSINGFTSPVVLTGYAQSGISLSFNPETVTPPPNSFVESTLTVTVATNVTTGIFQIFINGKSGSYEHTVTVTLEVFSIGETDFQIIAEPSSQKISQGESTFYVISIKSLNAFSSEVHLSASVNPPSESIKLVFDPELVTPPVGETAQSKLRISTLSSVAIGTYEINITGVGGERTHQTIVKLDVAPAFNRDETLRRFMQYKEMYQVYQQSFFNNSWWHELAQQRADAAATYDFYKESVNQFADTWLDYFETMIDLPISPLRHMLLMKDLAGSLITVYNMFLAMYLDNVAMCVWASYSRHDIRIDLDLLIAKINTVIQALNEHNSDALTSALHELRLATENAFAGSKSFDDAIYDVILTNPAYDLVPFLTRTKIYNGVRQHILSFRETLMLSYNDITSLQGKAESLNEKRHDGILSSRWNMPIVQDAYWEVNGVRVTQAQKGQEVKAHVIIRTLNISSVEYDMVEGSITVVIKKDIRFWFDQEYAKMSWNIKLNPGETEELVLPFIPDETSSITLKGYFIEITFSGKYLFPNNIISDSPVDWDDGSKGAMKDSYPPRLTVSETSGTSQSSGTVVMLTETQHRLYLHIYDENGRHVGLNYETGTIETQIPSCSYYEFNNGTAIVLPLNMTNFKVIVDAKYAQEENENYELTVITVREYEAIDKKSITSSITKEAKRTYNVQISQQGETVIVQKEEPIPWWIQHQLWILTGAIVAVAVATATITLIRKRRKYKPNSIK